MLATLWLLEYPTARIEAMKAQQSRNISSACTATLKAEKP
jgi:hypothetical protein